jgi:thioredoxin 1
MEMKPIEITDANFNKEVIEATVPVLIDFWAVWCGPCRAIAPIVEDLAGEYEGRAKIGKLDLDKNPDVAMKFGIRGIPTILIFKGGKVVDTIVGLTNKATLSAKLSAVV